MHGIGNDFPIIDESKGEVIPEADKPEACRILCHRNFGVGGDGVLFVEPSEVADIGYRMFNPDGSEAEMCGNGIRCFGDFVYRKGILKQEKMTVETRAGIKTIEITNVIILPTNIKPIISSIPICGSSSSAAGRSWSGITRRSSKHSDSKTRRSVKGRRVLFYFGLSGVRPAGGFLIRVSAVFAPVHLVFPADVRGIGGAGLFFAPAGLDVFVFMVPQVAGGDQFAVRDPALGQEPFLFPLFRCPFHTVSGAALP